LKVVPNQAREKCPRKRKWGAGTITFKRIENFHLQASPRYIRGPRGAKRGVFRREELQRTCAPSEARPVESKESTLQHPRKKTGL